MSTTTAGTRDKKRNQNADERADALDQAFDNPSMIVREQHVFAPEGSPYHGFDRTYKQRKLSSMPRLQFTKIMTKAFKEALSDGASIGDVIRDGMAAMNGTTADSFVKGMLSIAMQSPDLVFDIYMLSLYVPQGEREIVREIWNLPAEEDGSGGISDEDERELLSTFVRQNAEAMSDFYRETLPAIWNEARAVLDQTQGS